LTQALVFVFSLASTLSQAQRFVYPGNWECEAKILKRPLNGSMRSGYMKNHVK